MAKNETRRLEPAILSADQATFSALQAITNYAPANGAYDAKAGATLYQDLQNLQQAEAQTEAAFKAARDNAVAAEWAFHNYLLGAKDQVKAQFGANSNELQGLGLKKKTEYKGRTAKKSA
jgi:hypothetical protein